MKHTEYHFDTLAIRAGYQRTAEQEHSEALFPTSSYIYDSAEQAAARFSGEEPGNIYSRFTNPTVRAFEQRLAVLEGTESCVATASGMAGVLSTCMGLLSQGDHIVSSRSIFGPILLMFKNIMGRFGVDTDFVPLNDLAAWEAAIKPNTKMLFLETPSNPLLEIADVTVLAALAHAHDCLLVVDNTFCTPSLMQPAKLGADIIIHSATKYIDGQGRCLGGAVLGDAVNVGEGVYGFLRTAGPCMSPFNAWVFLKGLETLSLRMRAHSESAMKVASWLEGNPLVEKVVYPGLASHAQHALASRQQSAYGGVVSFVIKGGQSQAWSFVNAMKFLSVTANLGDSKTTITHPYSTTHSRIEAEERRQAGIEEGLIRIAVGLEQVDDICQDLERGFQAIR